MSNVKMSNVKMSNVKINAAIITVFRFELVLNSAVQRIENINTRICIRCASGVDYLVEKTIITIPLGVLKQRHQDLVETKSA